MPRVVPRVPLARLVPRLNPFAPIDPERRLTPREKLDRFVLEAAREPRPADDVRPVPRAEADRLMLLRTRSAYDEPRDVEPRRTWLVVLDRTP